MAQYGRPMPLGPNNPHGRRILKAKRQLAPTRGRFTNLVRQQPCTPNYGYKCGPPIMFEADYFSNDEPDWFSYGNRDFGFNASNLPSPPQLRGGQYERYRTNMMNRQQMYHGNMHGFNHLPPPRRPMPPIMNSPLMAQAPWDLPSGPGFAANMFAGLNNLASALENSNWNHNEWEMYGNHDMMWADHRGPQRGQRAKLPYTKKEHKISTTFPEGKLEDAKKKKVPTATLR